MPRRSCAALRSGRSIGSIPRNGGWNAPPVTVPSAIPRLPPNGSGSLRAPAERRDAGGAVHVLALQRARIDIARFRFATILRRIEIGVQHAGRAGELEAP